ncbi:hypothetical protein FO440_01165 [Mucilaginibacter corticis]|uniref:DUF748 domain-containing protein n=1 Tax=Mucilaginibacter corticis TaxID=2597670 RepID=A0A556MSQ4_9SPHI|nr:hypothetical protein [Mucilaginibacter corticis]TSJ42828.1 hypothetical protein FO440_01165 [Mucilaginibacter corticis]
MALKILKHKWHKVTLICFAIFLVLLFGAAFFLNRHWSPIFSDKIKSAVLTSTDSLYNVDFSAAELNVLEGKIVIYNIDLKIDTDVYNRLKKQHLAPNNLTTVHLKRLVLSHIHPFKLYFQHKLDIDRIIFTSPEIHTSYQLNHTKDTVNKDNRTTWQKISKSLKYIHVGDIFFNDVKFKYDDYSGNKLVISELKELNLQANELLIDSLTQTDTSRMLFCKDIVADVYNYKGKTMNGLYSYTINRLNFSTHTSQLNVEGVTLKPVANFFNKSTKERFTVKLDSIQLNHFDFITYHKYRSVSASSLVVANGSLDVFANPNGVKTTNDKIKSFPNVAIYLLKTDLKIDSIRIRNLDVSYGEYNKKSDQNGAITFNHTNAEFLNLTTNQATRQRNNWLKAHVTSRFMDRAKFETDLTFNLTDKDAAYTYKGSLTPMDLGALNGATVPFAMVKITSGTLKGFNFDFKADRKASVGKVTILYNDLKVKLLKNDTVNQKLKGKLFASMFANIFILKHNNPDDPGGIPRSFNVNFKRPVDFPFFKTIWHSLLLGIKPAVGYDEKTQKAVKARMAKGEIDKKNRKIKKQIRQRKRAERKLKKEREKAAKHK